MSIFAVDGTKTLNLTGAGTAVRRLPRGGALALTFTPQFRPAVPQTFAGHGPVALSVRAAGEASVRLAAGAQPGTARMAIGTGLSGVDPMHFVDQPGGLVLIADGVDPMLRWDPSTRSAGPAGVEAPDPTAGAPTLATTDTGPTTTQDFLQTWYAAVRYVDDAGTVSDLSPLSAPATAYNPTAWTYTDVPEPTGPRPATRQLLRTTAGQAITFYVDLEVPAHGGPGPYTSKTPDNNLAHREAVPLFDDLGNLAANTHGVPPSHKAVVVDHLGRLFAAVEVGVTEGHVSVTNGSAQVVGTGTSWPASLAGRDLRLPGVRPHSIASVDPATQVLTLDDAYRGATDPFAAYAIRSPDAERKLVYYTPAGEPEGWPPTFALEVQEDGDELTGLLSLASFLYILERDHVYRFTFKNDPATDGVIFLSSMRGCLTDRLWVTAEDTAYMLDGRGVHAFSGGASTPISQPVQDLFRADSDSPLRINFGVDPRYWHASWSGTHGVVRFFVSMAGSRFPRHALCFHPRLNRWWVEEYTRPVTAAIPGRLAGVSRVMVGTDHREVLVLEEGYSDGPRDPSGTTLGAVSAASPLSLSDARATFAGDAVNGPVWVVSGRGRGQWRRVVAVTSGGTRLEIDRPWLVLPDATSRYAVGGIGWAWTSGFYRYGEREDQQPRDVEVLYTPVPAGTGTLALALYQDYRAEPVAWSADRDGVVSVSAGDAFASVDLADARGRALFRLAGHREQDVPAATTVSVGLSGVQAGSSTRVHRVGLGGAVEGG